MNASTRKRARGSADKPMSTFKLALIALGLIGVLIACAAAEITFSPARPIAEDAAR